MQTASLFRSVPQGDYLQFGEGDRFKAKKVAEFMHLDRNAVSKIASVSSASVRWDENAPKAVRERLEEIGAIANMVADIFGGDTAKTALWFRTKNPLLGDIAPKDMVRLGRHDRLRRFIVTAIQEDQVR
ncbi:hypothetical protein BI317_09955 [Xanthomonas hortorum pv. gardneri]|uniref:hypothetical protein n=1 Tax=Xanthomonas hortorum TaxID=56454 RepID=UPI0009384F40|nr:hypothetical protein [Xanthomonas hortorum]APP84452.1 hypothetical protein BI317_09955 [Xanthomonas hortorum pv. gardneri]